MSPVSFSEDHFLHSVDISIARVPKSLEKAERAALTMLGVLVNSRFIIKMEDIFSDSVFQASMCIQRIQREGKGIFVTAELVHMTQMVSCG